MHKVEQVILAHLVHLVVPDRQEIEVRLEQQEVVDLLEQLDLQDSLDYLDDPEILDKLDVLDLPVHYCAVTHVSEFTILLSSFYLANQLKKIVVSWQHMV